MKITETFRIRRYWFKPDTPQDVLDTLNYRLGNPKDFFRAPYVDVQYWGEADRTLTMMELRYAEWIDQRQEISYTVEGDDGLNYEDHQE